MSVVRQLEPHPFCQLVPDMTPEQYTQLVEDIGEHGLIEPITLYQGKILDGRNRQRAVLELQERGHDVAAQYEEFEGGDHDAYNFVLSMNLHRRHLEYSQRVALAVLWARGLRASGEVKPGRPGKEREVAPISEKASEIAARKHQVGSRAVEEGEAILEAAPDVFEVLVDGGIGLREAQREVKARERQTRREELAARPVTPPDGKRVNLFNCPISELTAHVEAGSVDCIITDPPYDAINAFADLAAFATYALKEGGSLFAMTGQFHLPAILHLMTGERLFYWWTLAYLTPGGQSPQIFPRRVNTFWKPVLWFVKGELSGDRWYGDVVKSAVNDNDKRYHDWGQSVSGFTELIEKYTEPGERLCDPFMGGGVTGVAAMNLGRLFIGADKDETAFGIAQARIAEAIREQG